MSDTSRREFLKSGSVIVGASAFGGLAPQMIFAEETTDADGPNRPTLVVVYLRGGADPLNTIVPYGDPDYYDIRPTIAIPRADEGGVKGALHLDQYFGLHPALAPLMPLWNEGHLAPIVNVGSPHDTRSHFDAQDFMERACPGVKTINEGWLNRYLEMTKTGKDNELRALSFQPLLPRSLRGQYPVLAVPEDESAYLLDSFEKMYSCDENKKMLEEQAAKEAAAAAAAKTTAQNAKNRKIPERKPIKEAEAREHIVTVGANEIRRLRELRKITNRGMSGRYPTSRFGNQMRDIASVIKANRGLEVAAVDYEGWDHHAYQGGSEGTMANMLGDLAKVMRAFNDDLGAERMKRTLVVLMSEFGRTAKENGSHGSDHGHGGFMLAMGGMIKKKAVHGHWLGMAPENLYQKRDMPVTTDFRIVFSEMLFNLFGYDPTASNFFPGFRPDKPLNFLNRVAST